MNVGYSLMLMAPCESTGADADAKLSARNWLMSDIAHDSAARTDGRNHLIRVISPLRTVVASSTLARRVLTDRRDCVGAINS